MLRLTLHQMRSGWARLLAAAIAIMLGTGFVAAALLAGNIMGSAAAQSLTVEYRGAQLVVGGGTLTDDVQRTVADTPGVDTTALVTKVGGEIGTDARSGWGLIGVAPPRTDMLAGAIQDGALPTAADQIALAAATATRLGTHVGDSVTLKVSTWTWDEESETSDESVEDGTFTVTGLLVDATNLFNYTADALITPAAIRALAPDGSQQGEISVALDDGTDASQLASALRAELGDHYSVRTVQEVADASLRQLSGDTNPLTAVLLAFAGIALVVAVLVIGNTFSVLVAQRTRLLALLRTIGATRAQVRRSVLLEAALLGVISAALGLALGYGVAAGAIVILSSKIPGIDLWQGATITPVIAVGVVAVGLVATLVAGWVPARAATRIKPLAAMRPEPVSIGSTAGKVRATIAGLAVAGGAVLIVGGLLLSQSISSGAGGERLLLLAVAMGVLGGFASVFGLLLGAVFAIRPLVRAIGSLFGRGATPSVATLNAVRNPRRTAATTNALFIGVALVVMMATGAATAKTTVNQSLVDHFPVDLQVRAMDGQALTTGQIAAVTGQDGTVDTTEVGGVDVGITSGAADRDGYSLYAHLVAPDGGGALGDPTLVTDLKDGQIVLDGAAAANLRVEIGDTVTLKTDGDQGASPAPEPGDAESAGGSLKVTVARIAPAQNLAIVTPETLRELVPTAAVNEIWLRLGPDANAINTVHDLQDSLANLADANPSAPLLSVQGTAVERSTFGEVIDTMLLVVLALLGVAVVIALVGVANTLSLSVIERKRESATLRALGMTKGQLRGMLTVEGILIALVGTLTGIVGGFLYGWAGAAIIFTPLGNVQLTVPWAQIGWVIIVAAAAGAVASVLPSRSAVKVSPVAALAEE